MKFSLELHYKEPKERKRGKLGGQTNERQNCKGTYHIVYDVITDLSWLI